MSGCEWEGTSEQMITHLEQSHTEIVQFEENDVLLIPDYEMYDGHRDLLLGLSDYEVHNDYRKIITYDDRVFVALITARNQIWRFVLLCVGSWEIAQTYEYCIELSSSGKGSIKATYQVHSIKADLEQVYTLCQCFKLPLDVVVQFIIGNDLKFRFTVTKM